jgi:hypothetical protein
LTAGSSGILLQHRDVRSCLYQQVVALEMTLLGHDVHAHDAVNVRVLVRVGDTLLDHLCKLLKVLGRGDGNGVNISALVDHELGALWIPPADANMTAVSPERDGRLMCTMSSSLLMIFFSGRLQQCRSAIRVQLVDVDLADVKQHPHGVDETARGGVHEGGDAILVHGVDVGPAVLEEVLKCAGVTVGTPR